jgi:hypothetical protein
MTDPKVTFAHSHPYSNDAGALRTITDAAAADPCVAADFLASARLELAGLNMEGVAMALALANSVLGAAPAAAAAAAAQQGGRHVTPTARHE